MSATLLLTDLYGVPAPCTIRGGWGRVLGSPLSHLGPLPTSAIGMVSYAALIGLFALRLWGNQKSRNLVRHVCHALSVCVAVVSAVLIGYAVIAVGALCQLCLISAASAGLTLLSEGYIGTESVSSLRHRTGVVVAALYVASFGAISIPFVYVSHLALSVKVLDGLKVSGSSIEQLCPSDAHTVGSPVAQLVVVVVSDFECGGCHSSIPKLIAAAGAGGRLKLVFRHSPISFHQNSLGAAILAELMKSENNFWKFVDVVSTRDPQSIEAFRTVWEEIRLGAGSVSAEYTRINAAAERITRDIRFAESLGIRGTPAFVVLEPGQPPREYSFQQLFRKLGLR